MNTGSRYRSRRRLLQGAGVLLVIAAIAVTLVVIRDPGPRRPREAAADSFQLPFTLPCALDSADSRGLFVAVRGRDKSALMKMLVDRKYVMLREGAHVALSTNGSTTLVDFAGTYGKRTCYIPADMLPILKQGERK